MSKRLAKDGRETIEAKDVKLLTNLDEIDKTDYRSERVNTNKFNNNNDNQKANDNAKNNFLIVFLDLQFLKKFSVQIY